MRVHCESSVYSYGDVGVTRRNAAMVMVMRFYIALHQSIGGPLRALYIRIHTGQWFNIENNPIQIQSQKFCVHT